MMQGSHVLNYQTGSSAGFSLLEIMIALAIIAILMFVAIPSYQHHLVKVRRQEGKLALMHLAANLEKYYGSHHSYEGASIGKGDAATDVLSDKLTKNAWYKLVIKSIDSQHYIIAAIPQATQATADTQCQTLTLNHVGSEGIAAAKAGTPQGSVVKCWG